MIFMVMKNYCIVAICYLEYIVLDKIFERCEEIYFREKIVRKNCFLYLRCHSKDFKEASMYKGKKVKMFKELLKYEKCEWKYKILWDKII